jgi:nitroreductase
MPADADPSLFEIIRTTRSMRRLKSDPVPDELIREILEAGVCAPSGGNMQRWRFLVVTDAKVKETVAAYYKRAWNEYLGPTYRSGAPAPGADPHPLRPHARCRAISRRPPARGAGVDHHAPASKA